MRFLLDTNMIVAFARHGDRGVRHRMLEHRDDIALSSIVVHELCFGAFASDRPQFHLSTISDLPFPMIAFDEGDARFAGEIRARLRRFGTPIGPYDVMIAGQALARDLTLVTNNTREFERVDGLRLQDWIMP